MQKNDGTAEKVEESVRMAAFDQHRGLLFSIAYRMLGSVADAEDMLQETFLRWQQAEEGAVQSPRAYLVTIISRLCINHLQSARTQREEYVGQWLPEPLVANPANDPFSILKTDESLSMAFLVMLERLPGVLLDGADRRRHHEEREEQRDPDQHLVGRRGRGAHRRADEAQDDEDPGEAGDGEQDRRDEREPAHQEQDLQRV